MKWEDNKENYNGRGSSLIINHWDLGEMIALFHRKYIDINKPVQLTPAEELVYMALLNLEKDYRSKANYYTRREWQDRYKDKNEQLTQQLLEVTEERTVLSEKIKEAQITSGLFIQSCREKLNIFGGKGDA